MDSVCLHPHFAPGGPPWAQGTFAWLCHRFFQMVISGQRQGRVSLERVCGSSCTSQCFSLSWGHFLERHLLPLTSVRCNLGHHFVDLYCSMGESPSPHACLQVSAPVYWVFGYSYCNCTVIWGHGHPKSHLDESAAFQMLLSLSLTWNPSSQDDLSQLPWQHINSWYAWWPSRMRKPTWPDTSHNLECCDHLLYPLVPAYLPGEPGLVQTQPEVAKTRSTNYLNGPLLPPHTGWLGHTLHLTRQLLTRSYLSHRVGSFVWVILGVIPWQQPIVRA